MSKFLEPPVDGRPASDPRLGSRRYYAKLSQTEVILAPGRGEALVILLLEAFDADWFDARSQTLQDTSWTEDYREAPLFVLEVSGSPSLLQEIRGFRGLVHELEDEHEPEEWFSVVISRGSFSGIATGGLRVWVYSNLYQAGIESLLEEVHPVDEPKSAQLRRSVSTDHIPDAEEVEIEHVLKGIGSIEHAVAYDVGQGNAIGLCDARGSVAAYVDLGGGVLRNAFTFPAALRSFCFSCQPPILLTHWDFDHWSSANRDPRALRSTWIAPRQSVGPTHVALMAKITAAQGKILFLPPQFAARWVGQLHTERCTGRGRNHSGLAVTVCDQHNGYGDLMLFPGDARYDHIPSFANTQYLSVVAPHHGADMRKRLAPSCGPRSESRLVYSYGDANVYNHPHQKTRQDHHARAWYDPYVNPSTTGSPVRETANRFRRPFGHVLMAWRLPSASPAFACGGSSCQLEAQQIW